MQKSEKTLRTQLDRALDILDGAYDAFMRIQKLEDNDSIQAKLSLLYSRLNSLTNRFENTK